VLHRIEPAPTVILDTNVLVPNALRDALLRAAEQRLYEVRWSATTLRELERTLREKILAQHIDRSQRIERLFLAMRSTFPTATVDDVPEVADRLPISLSDRHVLAAAINSRASIIVTNNLLHFPRSVLATHRVVSRSPDQFLLGLFSDHADVLVALLTVQGAQLRQPRSLQQVLATLAQHTPRFAEAVQRIQPTRS